MSIVEMVNNWVEDERSLAGWSMVTSNTDVEKDVTLVEIFKSLFIYNDDSNKQSCLQRCSTLTDISKYDEPTELIAEREYSFSYMCAPSLSNNVSIIQDNSSETEKTEKTEKTETNTNKCMMK